MANYVKSVIDYLGKYTFTTGVETFAVYSTTGKVSYILTNISEDGNSFLMGAAEGHDYSTFSGVYEKTSLPLPPHN